MKSILKKNTARNQSSIPISEENLEGIFSGIGQKLREGRSGEAERILSESIELYSHTPDDLADLKRLLAFTYETLGRYKDSLEIISHYRDEEVLSRLQIETQVKLMTQLAVSYNNLGDHPKAVTLLKETLTKAEQNDLYPLIGNIKIGLARVYRKLNECPISRDHAKKALNIHREFGNWLGIAEAYREMALSYHQEGNSAGSVEYFDLGIQIIGEHSAPFMLGKLYTDLSGAYWFLRQPRKGIECLEKSIQFFEQTEHVLNSVIAYNNLGINLLLVGEWDRAEAMIKRAHELAMQTNHVHIAGILDSLGEVKILRGKLDEAEKLIREAVDFARERKREWYEAQAMRNLARCFLAQGKFEDAADQARKTIELSRRIGDKHYSNMAGLVLAESNLFLHGSSECEHYLQIIEDNEPDSDFYVLGSIQRIRGLAALKNNDPELAVHHFNRSLTIFETAEDVYHSAIAHLLIGQNLQGAAAADRAAKHLATAANVFRQLKLDSLVENADISLKNLGQEPYDSKRSGSNRVSSVASQLLTVRLAEATASRELLFRELIAVLQQESRSKKMIIADLDERKQLKPFITHGYSPNESADLMSKFSVAIENDEEKAFAHNRGLSVHHLKSSNAPHAFLFIHPLSGAVLNDETSLQPLLRVVELGMDVIALRDKEKAAPVESKSGAFTSNSLMPGFIHSSPAMTALVEEVYKIRASDVTVLVTGESGTGKELVARAIHTISNRKDKIFVPFNCTALPKELAEGHLFGYKRGAFTGATSDSPGIIRAADGGTLFLDEVGDLPLDVQPKLLRFLQEGEVQPLGEKAPVKVDVRVIAATNMPLEEKVANGSFREDLFYRLNVIRLRVPPLRERRSEIPPIVNYYINHYSSRFGKRDITFTPQTIDLLMVCNWDGNVRQLCNEVQRIIARAEDGEVIMPDHLSPELRRAARPITPFAAGENVRPIATFDGPISSFATPGANSTLEEAVARLETQMIKESLTRHSWNISRVANELGLTRRGLYLKLNRYGIEKAA